jgi:hypothetical protein
MVPISQTEISNQKGRHTKVERVKRFMIGGLSIKDTGKRHESFSLSGWVRENGPHPFYRTRE